MSPWVCLYVWSSLNKVTPHSALEMQSYKSVFGRLEKCYDKVKQMTPAGLTGFGWKKLKGLEKVDIFKLGMIKHTQTETLINDL